MEGRKGKDRKQGFFRAGCGRETQIQIFAITFCQCV